MGTRKRGTTLPNTDELTIERNKRARAAAGESEPVPEGPLPSVPDPASWVPLRPAIADFAQQILMAQTYARMAKDAGMLNVHTSEAQAQLLILRGFEMDIPPLRALNELYFAPTDQGGLEIVEEATLIRARVAKSGLGVIEPLPKLCNGTTATVRAIRHDHLGHRVEEFTYTLDDATHDGLMLKANWQSGANREALLTARATTKAARAWFSDVEGARYTAEELGGGGAPVDGPPARLHTAPPPPPLSTPTPTAPVTPPAGAGQATPSDATGANTAGGPHPPVAPPPGPAAAASPPAPPPSARGGAPEGASRQEKMAYYADVSRAMNRPWTSNVGMSRDAQPVPIITHGVTTDQITQILNYTVKGRTDFPRADEALQLVVNYLGELGIDSSLCPPPYCFFALTQAEAATVLQGLDVFARQDVEGDDMEQEPDGTETVVDAPPNAHDEVQPGQMHSWTQANDYLEAVLRRLVGHASRADVLGLMRRTTHKEFYEMTPDELFGAAADVDRLGKNPTILKQAIDRLRIQAE